MTAVADRTALRSATPAGSLTGWWELVRLDLRRERRSLALWVIGLAGTVAGTISAFASLYPDEQERVSLARGVASTPAVLVLTGPVSDTSVGGLTAWRLGVLGATLVGLMAVFTVVRRTRADEEAGRTELLASTVVGRAAPMVAALAVTAAASLGTGVLVAIAGIGLGETAAGSLCFGAMLAGSGLVFAAVAAVAAQLVDSARTAVAISGGVLGSAFILRAIGDVASGAEWLTWLSPIGWVEHVGAYGADNGIVLLLFVAAAVALTMLALALLARRDLGSGWWPVRSGPSGSPRLRSPFALAVRLQRGPLLGWMAGFVVFGTVTGFLADDVGDLLEGNSQMARALEQLGGTGMLSDAFLSAMAGFLGILAGLLSVSLAMRMRTEETTGRLEPVLATAVGRSRWMGGHLVIVLVGPVLCLVLAGVVTGLVHGVVSGNLAGGFGDGLTAALVQAPAAALLGGLAAALFGWLPRATGVAWAAVALALLLGQLGPVLQLPTAVIDLSPYAHVPAVPIDPATWAPVLWLTAIAVALFVAGLAGFRRRDVS
ncbi:ABC transporter permease [Nakamurella leprariae]|uniref:ABC transporter permease n=1 Tax=Nakamurella leprariae TaxID=2803911 RepID=A0A938YGR6_9ACTN|nr:ABC transporter permease [Nakamurella leprariae]MBM9469303.1 ABC transporter permease [Nakamurella leprariae]